MRDAIARGADALGVGLADDAASRLATLVELLLAWNERINVVGRCTAEQAVDRHVHDPLALLRLLDRPEVAATTTAWVDVGCGAGLPGLVLAVARPELELRLVEPIAKKIAFARKAVRELGLTNVTAQDARAEELPPHGFGGAMSRATFAPEVWAARGQELVAPGGLVLVMMGAGAPEALTERAWRVDRCTLPLSSATRVNVLLRAVGPAATEGG